MGVGASKLPTTVETDPHGGVHVPTTRHQPATEGGMHVHKT